jgi:hypothetical protein
MALTYSIDSERQIVTVTGDYADAAGWRTLLRSVSEDPAYRRGFGFIRDLRYSQHPVDAQTVIGIVAVIREFWDLLGVRRAAMVTRLGIDTPATVAEALTQDQRVSLRAFTSYEDAAEWVSKGDPPRPPSRPGH